jgi:hypothetical protein
LPFSFSPFRRRITPAIAAAITPKLLFSPAGFSFFAVICHITPPRRLLRPYFAIFSHCCAPLVSAILPFDAIIDFAAFIAFDIIQRRHFDIFTLIPLLILFFHFAGCCQIRYADDSCHAAIRLFHFHITAEITILPLPLPDAFSLFCHTLLFELHFHAMLSLATFFFAFAITIMPHIAIAFACAYAFFFFFFFFFIAITPLRLIFSHFRHCHAIFIIIDNAICCIFAIAFRYADAPFRH